MEGNGSLGEDFSEEIPFSAAEAPIRKNKRYSFSKRRDSGPLVEDVPSSKTISLADVCLALDPPSSSRLTSKTSKRKSFHKEDEDGSRKNNPRRNDSKKAESEALERAEETSKARVLRSTAKPTH